MVRFAPLKPKTTELNYCAERQAFFTIACRFSNPRNDVKPIANFHHSIKIFSRGKGASAVAKSAYRAAELIHNEYNGITSDYTRKSGVIHKEILLPDHAPAEYKNRSVLWNAVEKCERCRTAQLAREIEISLPVELTQEQNIILAREYVQQFVDAGMCADLCVHDKSDGNPHAHIMLTMRPIEKDGTWGQKSYSVNGKKVPTVDWNEQTKAEEWRRAWADIQNQHLQKYGFDVRVDHRSFERQGIDKVPTIHMGVAASQMEKRGIRTDKGNRNHEIADINKEIRQTKARLRKVKTWLYSQPIQNSPSFIDVMSQITEVKNLNNRWQKIARLQVQAQILIFLQDNNITDMEHFVAKVTEMNEELKDVSDEIKSADRRLETLALHLAHCENRKQHKGIYDKYKSLAPKEDSAINSLNPFTKKKAVTSHEAATKKQNTFYEKHSAEIEAYKDAEAYLKAVLNGRTQIPINTWQSQQKEMTAKRFALAEKFYGIKDEIKSAEVLRRGLEELMQGEHHLARQKSKSKGAEL